MTVNDATKKLVRQRAKFLCEYCHSSEEASAALFSIDHIIPQSLKGSDDPDNLALACQRCNGYRYNFTTGIDPDTGQMLPLFNPRQQKWSDHFIWSADGLKIIGINSVGRATSNRLDLNDERHNEGSIVKRNRGEELEAIRAIAFATLSGLSPCAIAPWGLHYLHLPEIYIRMIIK